MFYVGNIMYKILNLDPWKFVWHAEDRITLAKEIQHANKFPISVNHIESIICVDIPFAIVGTDYLITYSNADARLNLFTATPTNEAIIECDTLVDITYFLTYKFKINTLDVKDGYTFEDRYGLRYIVVKEEKEYEHIAW